MCQIEVEIIHRSEFKNCTSKSSIQSKPRTRPLTSLLSWNFILEGENARLTNQRLKLKLSQMV